MNTRFVPTSVHGAIDHVVGPTLIAAPEIFRLPKASPEGILPRVTGAVEAVYSSLTDYELSVKNVIPMRLHLALDAVSGAALATVPFATGAHRRGIRHWLPHTLVGAGEVALALTTKTQPPRTKAGRLAHLLRLKR